MHELSVTENILEIASRHAKQAGAEQVTDIHIVIGSMSSIVDDSIQFYWDLISKGTICDQSKLHFKRVPAEFECLDCGKKYKIKNEMTPCPKCHSAKIKMIKGDEFWLESIEVNKQKRHEE